MAKKLTDEERILKNEKRREKAKAKADAEECVTCKDPVAVDAVTFDIPRTCWVHVEGRNTVLKVRKGDRYVSECANEIKALDEMNFKRKL